MNKRITSIVLAIFMIVSVLVSAVPVYAETTETMIIKASANTTEASPGDTITYQVSIGAVTELLGLLIEVDIPEGLTYVEGSGKAVNGIAEVLNASSAAYTDASHVFLADPNPYTGTDDLVLFSFQCTVNPNASGNISLGFVPDNDGNCYNEEDNLLLSYIPAVINVSSAHTCVFDQKIVKEEALKTAADCENAAVYYKSCTCGIISRNDDDTFTNGELANHDYKTEWNQGDENGHWHDCKNCFAHDEQQAHIPGAEATEDTAQTCTACGYVIAPATGHIRHTADTSKWLYDETQHWHKCIGCDEKMDIEKHHGGTATCTELAICEDCGQPYGEMKAHDFTEKLEDADHLASAGDCQTLKTYYFDCANCDQKGTEVFESRTYGDHNVSDAWTTENGKHYHACVIDGCDYIEDEDECAGGTATCTALAVCSVCNQEYGELADHEYKTEWNQGDENGHWHDCKNCSAHDEQQAHIPGAEATEDTAQTCTECGYVIAPATGHIKHTADTSKWLYDETQHWHKCIGCDEKMDIENHHGGTATCTELAICEDCGQPYGELKAHDFTEKLEDADHLASAGDCQTLKTYYYDCANCDLKGTETFDGTTYGDHSVSETWTTENGKHYHVCTVDGCDYIADEDECAGGTATCTALAVCSVCNHEYGELADHDYKTEWNQGDENGHWHDCKNCSAHDEQQAHIPGAEATEDTAQTCTECGYVIAPATGHIRHTADTSKWLYDETQHWHKCIGCDEKMDIENHHGGTATCTELAICEDCGQSYGAFKAHKDENQDAKCDDCGQPVHVHSANGNWRYDSEYHWRECDCGGVYIDKSNHTAGSWIVDSVATYHKTGSRHKECVVCGYTLTTEIINKLPSPYVDVTEDAWYYDEVIDAYEKELMIGTNEDPTMFSPEMEMSRAQFVTILWRLEGEVAAEPSEFTDVADDMWFSDAIDWAAENGIILGYGDGTFGPDDIITREQVMLILNRYAVYKGYAFNASASEIEGYSYNAWAEESVLWAAANGMFDSIVIDISDLTHNANRAEMAVYLSRFCDNIVE